MGRTKSGKSGKRKPRGWWVIAILDEIEETGFVLVHWGGINPMTGKPWHDSWIPRENFKGSGEKMLRKWDKYKAREKDRLRRECAGASSRKQMVDVLTCLRRAIPL